MSVIKFKRISTICVKEIIKTCTIALKIATKTQKYCYENVRISYVIYNLICFVTTYNVNAHLLKKICLKTQNK